MVFLTFLDQRRKRQSWKIIRISSNQSKMFRNQNKNDFEEIKHNLYVLLKTRTRKGWKRFKMSEKKCNRGYIRKQQRIYPRLSTRRQRSSRRIGETRSMPALPGGATRCSRDSCRLMRSKIRPNCMRLWHGDQQENG